MFAATIITAKTQVLSGFLRSYAANFIRFFGVPPRSTAPASPAVSWSQATVPGCDDGIQRERRPGSVLRRARPEPLLGIRLSAPSSCTQCECLASRKYQELSHNSERVQAVRCTRIPGGAGKAPALQPFLFVAEIVPFFITSQKAGICSVRRVAAVQNPFRRNLGLLRRCFCVASPPPLLTLPL